MNPASASLEAGKTRLWLPWAGGLALLAMVLMLVESSQLQLTGFARPWPNEFWWKVRHLIVPWLLVAALIPIVVLLAWRWPIGRPLTRRIPLHLAGAVGFAFARLGGLAIYHSLRDSTGLASAAVELFRFYFVWDVVIYLAVVGATQAFRTARRLREAELATTRLRAELAEARLESLKAQLDPHFFFNVLNTASALVAQDRGLEAMTVISRLGELMRSALRTGEESGPLSGELAFAREYAALEQLRFGDRIRVTVESPPELDGEIVPRLLLQPLVENALRHGVSNHAGGGTVTVTANRSNGSLVLAVQDDGAGLPPGWSIDHDAGSGLRITRSRLHHLTEGRGRLTVEPRPGGGTIARIVLPRQPSQP